MTAKFLEWLVIVFFISINVSLVVIIWLVWCGAIEELKSPIKAPNAPPTTKLAVPLKGQDSITFWIINSSLDWTLAWPQFCGTRIWGESLILQLCVYQLCISLLHCFFNWPFITSVPLDFVFLYWKIKAEGILDCSSSPSPVWPKCFHPPQLPTVEFYWTHRFR